MSVKAWFIGGPFNGVKTELDYAPPYVLVGKHRYAAVYDPDTGDYLGGYCYEPPNSKAYAVNMLPGPLDLDPVELDYEHPWWKKWFK